MSGGCGDDAPHHLVYFLRRQLVELREEEAFEERMDGGLALLVTADEAGLGCLADELIRRVAEQLFRHLRVDVSSEREQEECVAKPRRRAPEQIFCEEVVERVIPQACVGLQGAPPHGRQTDDGGPATSLRQHTRPISAAHLAEDFFGLALREREIRHPDGEDVAVDIEPRGDPFRADAGRQHEADVRQRQELVHEGVAFLRLGGMVVVVDRDDLARDRNGPRHRLCEHTRGLPSRRQDLYPFDRLVALLPGVIRQRLREAESESGDVGHRSPAGIPDGIAPRREPLAGKGRLAVAGGREQQDDPRRGVVEERRQSRTLDDEARRPPPAGDRPFLHACPT